jgi:hypothetical protein
MRINQGFVVPIDSLLKEIKGLNVNTTTCRVNNQTPRVLSLDFSITIPLAEFYDSPFMFDETDKEKAVMITEPIDKEKIKLSNIHKIALMQDGNSVRLTLEATIDEGKIGGAGS